MLMDLEKISNSLKIVHNALTIGQKTGIYSLRDSAVILQALNTLQNELNLTETFDLVRNEVKNLSETSS